MKNKKIKILFGSILSTGLLVGTTIPLVSCTDPASNTTVTVLFEQPEGVIVTGQVYFRARVGDTFGTLSKPKAEKIGAKFRGWAIKDSEQLIGNNYIFQKDVNLDLIPLFDDQVKLRNVVGVDFIENTTITLTSNNEYQPDLQYSSDFGETWKTVTLGVQKEFNGGDIIYLRGNNPDGFNEGSSQFATINFVTPAGKTTPGSVNIFGDCMGLLDEGHNTINELDSNKHQYCFYKLFAGNASIHYVSDTFLPATVVAPHCYEGMFENCISIDNAPVIPQFSTSSLVNDDPIDCCKHIFYGCTDLNEIRLQYEGNFSGFGEWATNCATDGSVIYDGNSTVTGVPENWQTLVTPTSIEITQVDGFTQGWSDHPYQFNALCKKDGFVEEKVYQHVTWLIDQPNVASINSETGVLTGSWTGNSPENVTVRAYSNIANAEGVRAESSFDFTMNKLDKTNCVSLVSTIDNSTVSWHFEGSSTIPTFKYSTDGNQWLNFDTQKELKLSKNSPIYIKGNNPNGLGDGTSESWTKFEINRPSTATTGGITLGGTAMGMFDDGQGIMKDFPSEPAALSKFDYCFYNMFSSCDGLVGVSSGFLPAKTLPVGVYSNMFQHCKNLTSVPNLPAGVEEGALADYCYNSMYWGCSSLTTGVSSTYLSATQLEPYCYQAMFYNCSNLKTASELPATQAAEGCYGYMYQNCYSLNSIGEIKLQYLADEACLQMFCLVNSSETRSKKFQVAGDSDTYIFLCPDTSNLTRPVDNMFSNSDTEAITPTSNTKYKFA